MVPNGWTQKLLEDIAEFSQGIQVNPDKQFTEYSEGMVRFLRITDFVDQDETPRFIQNPSNRFIVNNTDLSMVRYGSAGAGDLVRGLSGAIANNLFRVIPNELEVTKDYLWVYLSQSKVKHFLFGNSTSSTMPAVSFKLVGKVLLDLPPLPEQQKIAKILSTWDKAISTTERLIDNSTQQKKALMQQLLTGKQRLLDESGKRFEGEWEKYPVGDICQSIVPGRNKPKEFNGHIPWVTTPEFQGRYIPSKLQKNYISQSVIDECGAKLVPEGAVVIAAVGDLGLTAIASETVVLNQQLHAFICGEKVYNEYLFYWLSYQKPYMESIASKTTIQYMNKKNCESIPVGLPTLEEQQKIATVLTNADKEIELLEQQLADLQQEKKALMQVLLTGKKRVKLND